MVLRSDMKFDIVPQWTLALRGDLPLVARNPITVGNPTGEFISGLGDTDLQAALIKTVNARWATGAAIRVIAPTGAPDLTSGKWQALPIVGARYSCQNWAKAASSPALHVTTSASPAIHRSEISVICRSRRR